MMECWNSGLRIRHGLPSFLILQQSASKPDTTPPTLRTYAHNTGASTPNRCVEMESLSAGWGGVGLGDASNRLGIEGGVGGSYG